MSRGGKSLAGIDSIGPSLSIEGQLLCADGSAAAPSMTFLSDTKLGFSKVGSNLVTSVGGLAKSTMSSTGLTLAGALSTGTSSISCGSVSSGALTATGPISCGNYSMGCGSLTTSGSIVCGSSIDCGINPMTCGALSSVSISSGTGDVGTLSVGAATVSNLTMGTSGIITAAIGDATAPSIIFAGDTKSGLCRASAGYTGIASGGTLVARFGASKGDMYVPLIMNGSSISSGALTAAGALSCGTNSLTCGAVTSSGTVSCGTNSLTCGAMSCSSLSSTGNVSWPQYYLRCYLAANQTISNSTHTLISYDTVETTFGGNSGFTVSVPQGSFAAPLDGTYLVVAVASWDSTAGGSTRNVWIGINNPSASPARRYNMTSLGPPSYQSTAVAVFRLVAGDTIQSIVSQNSGGNADLIGPGSSSQIFTSINILRVCA